MTDSKTSFMRRGGIAGDDQLKNRRRGHVPIPVCPVYAPLSLFFSCSHKLCVMLLKGQLHNLITMGMYITSDWRLYHTLSCVWKNIGVCLAPVKRLRRACHAMLSLHWGRIPMLVFFLILTGYRHQFHSQAGLWTKTLCWEIMPFPKE